MSKKILIGVAIVLAIVIVVVIAINLSKGKNVEGTLQEIMAKVYEGINESELPMMMRNTELTKENIEYFIGTSDIDFKEALASESAVTTIAHSVILIRLNDAKQAEEVIAKIKENVDSKNLSYAEISNVVVKSKGDLVILIMSNEELTPRLEANFDGLE